MFRALGLALVAREVSLLQLKLPTRFEMDYVNPVKDFFTNLPDEFVFFFENWKWELENSLTALSFVFASLVLEQVLRTGELGILGTLFVALSVYLLFNSVRFCRESMLENSVRDPDEETDAKEDQTSSNAGVFVVLLILYAFYMDFGGLFFGIYLSLAAIVSIFTAGLDAFDHWEL